MKYFLSLVCCLVLFASCRKNRDCVCTRSNELQTKQTYVLSIAKKEDAEADCQTYYETYSDYYSECELK